MGFVGIALLVLAVVALAVVVAARGGGKTESGYGLTDRQLVRRWAGGVFGFCLLFGVVLTGWGSYKSVDAGHVGIVYGPSGSIVGQMNSGGFLVPWDHVKQLDTRVQRAEYDNLQVYSKETISATADITVNYHVDPQDARGLIRTVGFKFAETLMQSRAYNDVKDATVKYSAVELAPNRENIRKYVADKLEAELSKYSIQVDAVQVKNIELPTTITTPLAERQAAVINAQAAQNKVKQVEAEARQKIAAAEGTAAANKAIANSVSTTPGYIDYLRAQALLELAKNPTTKVIPSSVFFSASDVGAGK